jgi:uncharacterized SAM-binding protein YcdF (DUF218 family)
VIALLAATLFFARRVWLRALGEALVSAEGPKPADAVLVLAGDYLGDRILKGAELVRSGFAPRAVISGPAGYYGHYECDLAIPFAVARGYPAEYFVRAPNRAHSTVEEAEAVLPLLRKMGVRSYLLVTSNFHTRRAGRVFRARGPDLEVRVVAAPHRDFAPDTWWFTREGCKYFLIEWQKTLATAAGL